jgi:hypothetical protein
VRRIALVSVALVAVTTAVTANAAPPALSLAPPTGLAAQLTQRAVTLRWQPVEWPSGLKDRTVLLRRDNDAPVELPAATTSYVDTVARLGDSHSYAVASRAARGSHTVTSAWSAPVAVTLPSYVVGAATRDITPSADVNLGGFGLGDGSVLPGHVRDLPFGTNAPGKLGGQDFGDREIVGRGGHAASNGDRIRSRALVIGDGAQTVAIASVETQGMFAKYQEKYGDVGLVDIAAAVSNRLSGGLAADHILIATDHTHRGPDTIGAWGGVTKAYLDYVKAQTVDAIVAAYDARQFATLTAGESDASDLVYNQSCSEALNQSAKPDYPGPEACATPGKDGIVRVLRATAPDGSVVATYMAFAAHATTNIGGSLNGDWPQFVSEEMSRRYGGTGLAMVGALGGTQPCRPTCAFTKQNTTDNPGFGKGRDQAIVENYVHHVDLALTPRAGYAPRAVTGPVAAAQAPIREAITGPAVLALFAFGHHTGTELMRSHDNPWVVGTTIRTLASAIRVGDVLFAGTPGEGFPAIGAGIRSAVTGARTVIQLGLANDQLGYLISPARYVPIIAAEVAVNDNIIFNVSPTIGDHVMCSDIALAVQKLGFAGAIPPDCLPFTTTDSAGDPIANIPVGGITAP